MIKIKIRIRIKARMCVRLIASAITFRISKQRFWWGWRLAVMQRTDHLMPLPFGENTVLDAVHMQPQTDAINRVQLGQPGPNLFLTNPRELKRKQFSPDHCWPCIETAVVVG